ncbi:hypothetical protein V6N13_109528 [Hibiscus sabdariffa]
MTRRHVSDFIFSVGCLMLATMTPELQKQHENMVAYEMIQNLKEIYEGQARQERYETSKALFQCKMSEGSPVGAHVIKMMGYIQTLEKLGFALNDELAVDVVLQSLPDSFNQFGGSKSVLMVREAKGKGKKVAKSKGNGKTKPKGKEALKPKGGVSKDGKCFHCGKTGHWKRNCPIYLEDVKKAKAVGASVSGMGIFILYAIKPKTLKGSRNSRMKYIINKARVLKTLRSDRVREYLSLDELLKECGIVSQLTPPGTPQWNGVSERRNRTLLDMVRSMMSHTDLPTTFWGYALETAAFTLNRVPSKSETKGYYFYNENKVFVARTGVFLEKEFLTNSGKGRNIELEEVQQQQVIEPEVERISQDVEENPTDLETQPLRRSTRERHEPERYGFLVTTHGDVILVDLDEPKTYQEAVASSDSEKWLEAMRSEMDSMSENQVWTLVEPPEGIKPIGCKWVFKKKTDMDGNVQTYKGRLVAKGFRQIHGVDYDETFSPVAMFKSIRILLAVAAFHDYEIWQMDVKTAFLNGKLEEDVYMTQPEGFVTPEDARKVCKLQRSIYGLKQASRSWNLRFNEAIQEFGFIRNEDEPCVYKKFSGSIVSFLILYVDDILIIGNDIPTLQSIKTWLSNCFSMKDLGEAAYILGVKIYRDRSRRLLGLS